jgi:hypothetical protein
MHSTSRATHDVHSGQTLKTFQDNGLSMRARMARRRRDSAAEPKL